MNNIIDRTTPPPFHIPEDVNVLFPAAAMSGNGVKLYSIEAGGQDVIRLSLVFRAGTRYQTRAFLASATLYMLAEGTERFSGTGISEKTDYYGANYEVNIDRDYSMVSVYCLSKFLPEMLELLEEIVAHPAFPEKELGLYKAKRKQQLTIEREKPSVRARELFGEAMFGKDHPYGVVSPAEKYDELTPEHLRAFHKEFYGADNCFAVTSGFVGKKDVEAILRLLEKLPVAAAPHDKDIPVPSTIFSLSEERKDAVQTALRIGKLLFTREHPDFIGMQVLATLLGGYFGSRLVSNLREEKGYTYGIFSAMVNLEHAGYLAVATEVGAQFTEAAVKEIFAEIRRLREEPVGEDELNLVKSNITGEFMRILDGPFGIADVTIENIQCGKDNGYIRAFLDEVEKTTPERLRSLAKKYLQEEGFVTVTVGKTI